MSLTLPTDFAFNQANLQDWTECKRRFLLRHLQALAWPAVEAEPADAVEAHTLDGDAFHRLIHQAQVGLPRERLAEMAAALGAEPGRTGRLWDWWRNYLARAPADLPPQRHPEVSLSTPLGRRRLVAKYDLIAIEPGQRAIIVDWKTSERRPTHAWLAARLQTRVYRYVLAAAGAHLNGGAVIQPEQIAMVYWFAEFPEQSEVLFYDRTQHEADRSHLEGLAAAIEDAAEEDFVLTPDVTRCRFCPYRSLCGRGVEAGDSSDAEVEPERPAEDVLSGFDYEQVGEVVF